MPKERKKVNICVAINLIDKAIIDEKKGIKSYKELETIENPEFRFGNSFLYMRHDEEKHLSTLERLRRHLQRLKEEKEISCTGI